MHAPEPQLGFHRRHQGQAQYAFEKLLQFVLVRLRHRKIPEGAKAPALIGVGDGTALAHDALKQRALGATPQRNPLAHAPAQPPKVVLDLPDVFQQLARQTGELLKPVF